MKRYNDPFHFAIPHGMPTEQRAGVLAHIERRFGIKGGRVSFVSADARMRLYKVTGWVSA